MRRLRFMPAVQVVGQTIGQTILFVLFVLAAINFAVDVDGFNHLAAALCNGTVPNTADYCSSTYHFRCAPMPANCTGDLSYIPPYQFAFAQIIPPIWQQASILGYAWWLLEWAAGLIINTGLFMVYVVCQPLVFNPLLWWVLMKIARANWSSGPRSNPLLELVQNQKALGSAATASRSATHAALLGGGSAPTREFSE